MPKEVEGIGKLFDVQEIMDIFEVAEITVLRNFRSGKLKGRKFGKKIYFTEGSLKDFFEGKPSLGSREIISPKMSGFIYLTLGIVFAVLSVFVLLSSKFKTIHFLEAFAGLCFSSVFFLQYIRSLEINKIKPLTLTILQFVGSITFLGIMILGQFMH